MSDPNYISEERFEELLSQFAALVPHPHYDFIKSVKISEKGTITIKTVEWRDTPSRVRIPLIAEYQIYVNR